MELIFYHKNIDYIIDDDDDDGDGVMLTATKGYILFV